MEKLIITAAICGAEVLKEHNPAVPYTVEECVREARSAYDAGASIIHLHVRYDDGTPTQDKARFKVIMDAIREACPDVIIQPSTGGAVGMTDDERLQPTELHPEMATLDCGTLNFGGDEVFMNTENTIRYFGQRMIELGIKPELEVFDKSMIEMALRMHKKGFIKAPMHFDFVMGVNGGIGGDIRDFVFYAIVFLLMQLIPLPGSAGTNFLWRFAQSLTAGMSESVLKTMYICRKVYWLNRTGNLSGRWCVWQKSSDVRLRHLMKPGRYWA